LDIQESATAVAIYLTILGRGDGKHKLIALPAFSVDSERVDRTASRDY
jgi:hypothetical protein